MAKTKKRARGVAASTWGGEDHEYRKQRKLCKEAARSSSTTIASSCSTLSSSRPVGPVNSISRHREAVLTHETAEKRSALQLRLHLTKTQREIQALKSKLTSWDPLSPPPPLPSFQSTQDDDDNQVVGDSENEELPKKKKGRKGPESWKLKGAARPAWQVYDFDTRYEDPYIKAHETAREVRQRSLNLLTLYKGRLASVLAKQTAKAQSSPQNKESCCNPPHENETDVAAAPFLRHYLSLLMQLGHLSLEAGQYKAAREAWWECIELEGKSDVSSTPKETAVTTTTTTSSGETPQQQQQPLFLTTARESMIRMYLHPPQQQQLRQQQSRRRRQQQQQQQQTDEPRWELAWKFLSDKRIAEKSCSTSTSVWIAYSRALVACKLHENNKKNQNQTGNKNKAEFSTQDLESYMIAAIRNNVFCAYYLAFYDKFQTVMEYTEDLQDGDDDPLTDLEEAIEYCNSDSGILWQQQQTPQPQPQQAQQPQKKEQSTSSSASSLPGEGRGHGVSFCVSLLRRLLEDARTGRHESLTSADVEWKKPIDRVVQEHDSRINLLSTTSGSTTTLITTATTNGSTTTTPASSSITAADDEDETEMPVLHEHEHHHGPDVKMYAGMFQTAMEMLHESGQL